jgi:transketolase
VDDVAAKAFVIAGDAESEEGMSYEARNLVSTLGARNLIVTLDHNHLGIDGPIRSRSCRRLRSNSTSRSSLSRRRNSTRN